LFEKLFRRGQDALSQYPILITFPQLYCHCGRTVLEPPIPCGTRVQCNEPCNRPPSCDAHPLTAHSCHPDTIPCPPCPFLTRKLCACGKKMVPNVRCSLERDKIGCGSACQKLMSCGFHHCKRLCHGDECGSCTASCGKPRKPWYALNPTSSNS
jgi:transcriptional repressor NF-X1